VLSNSFWYEFLMGVGIVFLVLAVTRMIARAKKIGG
jgi:hypothetical protein